MEVSSPSLLATRALCRARYTPGAIGTTGLHQPLACTERACRVCPGHGVGEQQHDVARGRGGTPAVRPAQDVLQLVCGPAACLQPGPLLGLSLHACVCLPSLILEKRVTAVRANGVARTHHVWLCCPCGWWSLSGCFVASTSMRVGNGSLHSRAHRCARGVFQIEVGLKPSKGGAWADPKQV